jgi:ABC-type transporter Mla subunit MlaD
MMQAKREQALVGLFVLVAAAVLFATVFAMSGAFGRHVTKRLPRRQTRR